MTKFQCLDDRVVHCRLQAVSHVISGAKGTQVAWIVHMENGVMYAVNDAVGKSILDQLHQTSG